MICSRSKRFPALLCAAEFHEDDVLYSERTSRFLKPAFTVIRDQELKCLLVFIRGTRSIKDTLIDALCASVSFDHNMVSGHAHRGMVVAADWISKHCIPVLLEALRQYPHFKIKIVGHSLGGGVVALLTHKLREMEELSSTRPTCVTFGSGISLLKIGGRMVYSTCSMNPIENEAVVAEKNDLNIDLQNLSKQGNMAQAITFDNECLFRLSIRCHNNICDLVSVLVI
ncbi:sn1-specific diacylglycerol lipase beta-like isoform X1 [Vigna unguiculata]|uniref:sn1-specific diacylglycerol lipase beta-like isoform X1 n=1 Tax=Vigna unguiculata TaxID=3917 RepID=UPI001016EE2A|nr:sn1-specific diacylglycerol lipase beta-like isoform X1 [Vigna unguiculata]